MKTIPIFFSFDDNYVKPAAVAFWSLLDKADKNVSYDMYVLHHDISDENQKLLLSIVEKAGNAKLTFKDTGAYLLDAWEDGNWEGHQKRNQFNTNTIIKCFAATMFPWLDKIIYSDVDVVFTDDISELWDTDVASVYFAGVKNAFLKHSTLELSHLKPEHYEMLKDCCIAGGIWVMNLKKIREDNIEKRMMEVVRDGSIVKRWPDQDIINIACVGKVGFLPLNYISYPYLLEVINKEGFESHFSRDELYDSFIHPKIIHYAAIKPWNAPAKRQEIWWGIHDYLGLGLKPPLQYEQEVQSLRKWKKRFKRKLRLLIIFLGAIVLALAVARLKCGVGC